MGQHQIKCGRVRLDIIVTNPFPPPFFFLFRFKKRQPNPADSALNIIQRQRVLFLFLNRFKQTPPFTVLFFFLSNHPPFFSFLFFSISFFFSPLFALVLSLSPHRISAGGCPFPAVDIRSNLFASLSLDVFYIFLFFFVLDSLRDQTTFRSFVRWGVGKSMFIYYVANV